jgi:hypothetical protein
MQRLSGQPLGWNGVTVMGLSLGLSSIVSVAIPTGVLPKPHVTDDIGEKDFVVGACFILLQVMVSSQAVLRSANCHL